ncbi:discoidin domain-containing protein [Pedobacter paludis]|uniref:F5/8 type C domain-containing protein n=1 Tax=Pedobacter paludis TaxID=2203212 RepID=A0A317F5S5_9SPHI|nr:discoidin domain-containing protein [Pedobacter paludis]PWS32868.1 hypothetical protein DF947_07305 [Pedobacter paludis]
MKKIYNILFPAIIAVLTIAGCKKDKDATYPVLDGAQVTTWQDPAFAGFETDGSLKQAIVKQRIPGSPDSLYNFSVKGLFSKAGVASTDIPVTFTLDYSTLDSLNYRQVSSNRPVYEKAPDSIFTFKNKTGIIKTGTYSTDEVFFSISSAKIKLGHLYIVPIRATSSGFSTSSKIVYFVIKGIDPFPWSILSVDSEETSGEGPNNGFAKFAIDGNVNTFWHTQWQGGSPGLPHYIAIDTKRVQPMAGIVLTNRQGASSGVPKKIDVSVSSDGTTWTPAGSFNNISTGSAPFKLTFPTVQSARYFKITVTETYGNTNYCFYAEINIF